MEQAELRLVPSRDRDWWSQIDEGHWQALLEQGEVAAEVVAPVDPHEILSTLDLETNAGPANRFHELDEEGEADAEQGWERAQQAMDRGESFTLEVTGANRGGLLVDWNGLQGFIPASHLCEAPRQMDPRQRISELARHIGGQMAVRIIEVEPQQSRLVFSERAAQSSFRAPATVLNNLVPGDVCEGTVTNLTTFGAFVDLGGVEGLIHVSELSWDRVRHPSDVLSPGQQVRIHVLGVNADEGRVALSLKRLRPNPWTDVAARFHPGQVVEGLVTNVVSFGAFVRIEEGLEGLIHISELAEGSFLHPRNVVREGDTVRVRVLNIDPGHQRLGLSLRQMHEA
ncbi:MAG: S1 RNA-binding domain-containing protein [Chloroflexi bacterium]|nr:MAG: S1 RNA-binding domain-containing protein [Chloroflexota bacterium]